MKSNQPITKLRNLGPRSEQLLAFAGIKTEEELRDLGSVAAYARVVRAWGQTNLNLLWAIEGALTDLPWQTVARLHRTTLLLALDDYIRDWYLKTGSWEYPNEAKSNDGDDSNGEHLKPAN